MRKMTADPRRPGRRRFEELAGEVLARPGGRAQVAELRRQMLAGIERYEARRKAEGDHPSPSGEKC
jgi:hypothetical protein